MCEAVVLSGRPDRRAPRKVAEGSVVGRTTSVKLDSEAESVWTNHEDDNIIAPPP